MSPWFFNVYIDAVIEVKMGMKRVENTRLFGSMC